MRREWKREADAKCQNPNFHRYARSGEARQIVKLSSGPVAQLVERSIRPDLINLEMFYCYILKSLLNNSRYIGSCKETKKRIKLHNNKLVPSTKRYAPWILVYEESFDTLSQARKRELQIKSWKNRAAVEKLIKTFQGLK